MERIKPFLEKVENWNDAIMNAYNSQTNLSANGYTKYDGVTFTWEKGYGRAYKYHAYGCSAAMVEVDLLTGDHQILKSEILLDVGKSLNEALDIGQIEGGFMQGIGWLTTEDVLRGDKESNKWIQPGYVRTNGPGFYKIPTAGDLPHSFGIEFLENGRNPGNIYSSKACSESPVCLATSVGMAIIDALRPSQNGNNELNNNNSNFESCMFKFPMSAPRIRDLANTKL
ncbi:hypothetical protein TRFO_03762 [Tritrichomonas foetus]|uniref:Aldehyde oxidase/xanthine dehydrogenase second molybdopterin binding domain-containing protein n=1 Tax=Tritrichomonas foetus TaxID=1144522 RepID=A0A1J4KQQ3_9EUKA|nr:hypothetical protein TRFO_03762 [Tritrichomonas foetus]|eukprot:OHT12124.1 hypothetical protein TRFO_03762 [Tritrichomonas foetus]